MKRLTLEEASKYISIDEDYFKIPPSFYTLSEDEDGWETVKYYTNRKLGMYSGREGEQYVYVLSNPTMPGILKIGYTELTPEKRSKQVSNHTGVPAEYEVEFAYRCVDGKKIEKEVHIYLRKKRLNRKREHFTINLEEAIEVIEKIGNKYI